MENASRETMTRKTNILLKPIHHGSLAEYECAISSVHEPLSIMYIIVLQRCSRRQADRRTVKALGAFATRGFLPWMFPRTCLAWKMVYRSKNALVHWSAARAEERVSSRGSTACPERVHRGSKAGFDPPPLYIACRLFVLLPGHAVHQKGLQKQKSPRSIVQQPGPKNVVRSRINRLSNAGPKRALIPHRFT